jgi:ubiquinone/menaquinone biosynthesis C-methylase UbiE
MWRMGGRRIEPEFLDEADPREAEENLKDIIRLNESFGGHAIVRDLLKRAVERDDQFSMLDVGAASGDTARLVSSEYPRARIVSFDLNAFNFRLAPRPKVRGDAFELPFAAKSFDLVFCSLFLHHFEDEKVVDLLRDFARLARKAVLISDLERHTLAYWFLPATKWIYRWHWMTVHDGKISIRAAFTGDELRSLAERAGMIDVGVSVHRPAFRLSLIGTPKA